MKKLLIVLVILICPVTVFSHPGKTDKYGGHKCLNGCEDWGLWYGEYHLHDKDGKPIRIARKTKKRQTQALVSMPTETVMPLPSEPLVTAQTVTVYRYVTNVYEENVFASNPFLWLLLVLLLLLLIFRLNRKRSADR
jgi:hypothetical protein